MEKVIEEAVVAYALRDPVYVPKVLSFLEESSFEHYRGLYQLIKRTWERHKTLLTRSILKLSAAGSQLQEAERLRLYDEFDRLTTLPATDSGFGPTMEAATQSALTMKLVGVTETAVRLLQQKKPLDVLNLFRKNLTPITMGSSKQVDLVADVDARFKRMEELRKDPTSLRGVGIGIKVLDESTMGFRGGEFVVFIGESGSGKSTFLLCAGYHAFVNLGKNVAFFSLEMPVEQVLRRFDCRHAGISYEKFRKAQLTDEEMKKYWESLSTLKGIPGRFDVFDIPQSVTATTIDSHLQTTQVNYDLVIVDYLGLMRSNRGAGDDWQEQGFVAFDLRQIARERNIPILSGAQVTTEGYGNQARSLKHLARSRMIVDHADFILDAYQKQGTEYVVNILKGRDVQKKPFRVFVDFDRMLVGNVDDPLRVW